MTPVFVRRCTFLVLAGLACAPYPRSSPPSPEPRTRAERSGYRETSTYADVQAFLRALRARGAPVALGTIGTTSQGRPIPYIIASRPRVETPAQARALHRPIVYVNANIHAGEVEGKEAILALVRDLTASTRPNVLDSLVLIAVPIYNADGNEQFGPQSVNRDEQFGPERVGIRANAQGLDLNRDYVKAEAPETRGALAMFTAWDPDVYVDLHTTDGSYHHFALTYSPSLNPLSYLPGFAGAFTRDTLIPEVRRAMHARGFETFDYGNFGDANGGDEPDITDTVKHAWYTFDHRPRFGTNYYGMRGRVSILSEAFSHDPFERRVASTYAFVSEILSAVARHAGEIARDTGGVTATVPVPIRARLTTHPYETELPFEVLRHTGDSAITQPGVPPGIRRTGRFHTQRMPIYDRFEPTSTVELPLAYVILPGHADAIALLRRHGIPMRPATAGDVTDAARLSEFVIDSVKHARVPFQGHHEARVYGEWRSSTAPFPEGATLVPATGRLAALAAYLLEPRSDDGLLAWNVFDAGLHRGSVYPVLRLVRRETGRP